MAAQISASQIGDEGLASHVVNTCWLVSMTSVSDVSSAPCSTEVQLFSHFFWVKRGQNIALFLEVNS